MRELSVDEIKNHMFEEIYDKHAYQHGLYLKLTKIEDEHRVKYHFGK